MRVGSASRVATGDGRAHFLASSALSGWLVLCGAEAVAQNLPSGGVVVGGSATITQSSATRLDINQTTDRAVINWNSFSIGSGHHVDIRQPGSGSASVQQVVGQDPSRIFGQLTSNGRVIIANPNGIWFGPGSRVDVAGLVASTATMSAPRANDFIAGGAAQLRCPGAADRLDPQRRHDHRRRERNCRLRRTRHRE